MYKVNLSIHNNCKVRMSMECLSDDMLKVVSFISNSIGFMETYLNITTYTYFSYEAVGRALINYEACHKTCDGSISTVMTFGQKDTLIISIKEV